ncbi:RNA polymerase sigma factor [Olivibacter domesticus]|uniref:RNA polymerase sigma-70 factor, ECF subfamily n=1 Tax=Olivibacter domesticus TaxID=407022 RepID=A0A1H7ZEM8_OLID1|nr:sigma-70 family RNA polymerase sigma factor [Olivibacter domesticus]SEM56735.1 RNA polymerase sigma-70 factor, ECF subfamily [Olivibacter domesticus]
MNLKNEGHLLGAVASGDEGAFRQLFDAYHNKLALFIYRLTKDRLLTDELVQDVFVKIWNRKEHLLKITNFDSYLFAMAKNLALNALRDLARRSEKHRLWEVEYDEADLSEQQKEFFSLVNEAIDHLPTQQREVYLLSKYEKYKHEQIAQKMDLSQQTVKKYVQRATQHILAHLRNKFDVFFTLIISVLISFL